MEKEVWHPGQRAQKEQRCGRPCVSSSRVLGECGTLPGPGREGLAAGIPDEVRKGREGWTLRGPELPLGVGPPPAGDGEAGRPESWAEASQGHLQEPGRVEPGRRRQPQFSSPLPCHPARGKTAGTRTSPEAGNRGEGTSATPTPRS